MDQRPELARTPEIIERLKEFSKSTIFKEAVEESVRVALSNEQLAWLSNLAELLSNENLRSGLSPSTLTILEKYKGFIWD